MTKEYLTDFLDELQRDIEILGNSEETIDAIYALIEASAKLESVNDELAWNLAREARDMFDAYKENCEEDVEMLVADFEREKEKLQKRIVEINLILDRYIPKLEVLVFDTSAPLCEVILHEYYSPDGNGDYTKDGTYTLEYNDIEISNTHQCMDKYAKEFVKKYRKYFKQGEKYYR